MLPIYRLAAAVGFVTIGVAAIAAPAYAQSEGNPLAVGMTLRKVSYADGRFEQQPNGGWTEFNAQGRPVYTFREQTRTPEAVKLLDPSRNTAVEFDLLRLMVRISFNGSPFENLYSITGTQHRNTTPLRPVGPIAPGQVNVPAGAVYATQELFKVEAGPVVRGAGQVPGARQSPRRRMDRRVGTARRPPLGLRDPFPEVACAARKCIGSRMFKDRVLFIDGEAIVIDKPAGLPVDRPRDRSTSLEDMLGELTFGFQRLPLPVHRLDRDTSGCLLLARNPKAHKRFGQAFEAGQVTKRYVAILDGEPDEDTGEIDLPLIKVSTAEEGWRMTGDPSGKSAKTRWKVLERVKGRAMVAFFPETGRTHQLRVHAAEAMGIPIVGDPVYGKGGPAVMLHAAGLIVPREGKPDVTAEAPLPLRFHNIGFGRSVAPVADEVPAED